MKAQSSPLSTTGEISTPVTPISPPEFPLSSDTPTKKRRAPNAFILYRSFIIAQKLYPPELTHQNEVSRYVAEKWRAAPADERARFFKMAKEEKERLEAELPGIEPSKRKRTKTKTSRTRTPRTDSPRYHLESPESRESDAKFPTLTLPFDYSALSSPPQPQAIPAPTFDAYTPVNLCIGFSFLPYSSCILEDIWSWTGFPRGADAQPSHRLHSSGLE